MATLAEQIPSFALILLITSLLSIFSGVYILLKKKIDGYQSGALFTLSSSAWSIGYALELASPDLNTKLFWFTIRIISTITVPLIFINFVINFIQLDSIKLKMRYLLAVPMFLSVLLIITNGSHNFMWNYAHLNPEAIYSELIINYNLGLWFSLGYIYAVLFFASGHILSILHKYRKLYWRRVTSLFLCVVFPWVTHMLFMVGVKPFQYDVTPLLINLASLILIFVTPEILYRRDIMHVARELIVDGIKDAVLVIDPSNNILDANSAARQLINLPMDGRLEGSLNYLFPDIIEQVDLESPGGELHVSNTGGIKVYDVSISNLQNWVNSSSSKILVLRDITELHNYSEKLEQLVEERTKQLRNAERMITIGETAAMVGHDLRNPLQVIVGTLYFLKRQFRDILADSPDVLDEVEDMLETLSTETDYMNKIVLDLHDYAKSYRLEVSDIDVKSVIEGILPSIITDDVEIIVNFDELTPIKADETCLKRTFWNIITNAIQAMPEGGTLTIQGHKIDDVFYISFNDTGVGIPEENMSKLFIPLFTTKSKGTGFGLAVCKRFVESHGGKIVVESKPGEGSTFTVIIPNNNNLADLV